MRMCSIYYNGMFSCDLFQLPQKVLNKSEIEGSPFEQFMTCSDDLLCKEVEYKCRMYKEGDIVVLKREDATTMIVGLVKGIVVKVKTILLIIKKFLMKRNSLRFYESHLMGSEHSVIELNGLQDSYPLFKRGTEGKFVVLLHHHVSFEFS